MTSSPVPTSSVCFPNFNLSVVSFFGNLLVRSSLLNITSSHRQHARNPLPPRRPILDRHAILRPQITTSGTTPPNPPLPSPPPLASQTSHPRTACTGRRIRKIRVPCAQRYGEPCAHRRLLVRVAEVCSDDRGRQLAGGEDGQDEGG